MTINGCEHTYASDEVLYENDSYKVYCAVGGLPAAVGRELIYMDGYVVINKLTGQQDGEYRSYALAVVQAHEWDSLLGRVSHIESGIHTLTPNVKN